MQRGNGIELVQKYLDLVEYLEEVYLSKITLVLVIGPNGVGKQLYYYL